MSMKAAKAHNTERGFKSLEEAMTLALNKAATAQGRSGQSGISTGVAALDDRMRGLHRSHLVILAGGLGVGKTSLSTSIAYNIASAFQEVALEDKLRTSTGGIVGFYSLAMSAEELATRIISDHTKVPLSKIRRGDITDADFEKLVACSQKMQKVPLYIDQTGSISVAQLSARARRIKRQRGLDVVIIDDIHRLVPHQVRGGEDEAAELARTLRELKSLAKEIDVAIFAVFETHGAETAEYKSDLRLINAELDKGTIDFATLIRRQTNANAIEISFWDSGPAESTEEGFDGSFVYSKNERQIVDFSEYMSRKLTDWDNTLKRIDEDLKRFELASGS